MTFASIPPFVSLSCFLLLLFISAISAETPVTTTVDDGLHEVVLQIAAHHEEAKWEIIKEIASLGYGSECPKSNEPYVHVKVPQQELAKLKQMSFAPNMTIVEDPTRTEYLRFYDEQQQEQSRFSKRQDPFGNLYDHYHTQAQLSAFLDAIVDTYPNIARKYSIGKTTQGADLWAIRITDNPDVNEVGEVEFHYIANMHGDEVVGRELSLYFIYHLCSNYATDPTIQGYVDNTDIHILPTMNPDGYASGRRANGRGKDLNRNFVDQYFPEAWGGANPLPPVGNADGSFKLPTGSFEPEVVAVMKWMGAHNFALGANFHGGAVVANYPYDSNANGLSGRYASTPDDNVYKEIARTYAAHNIPMLSSREFQGGITNGAQWYVLNGGMQDYAYLWHGTLHITVELSDQKWPAARTLINFWNNNRESMLAFLAKANYRVWGTVTDCVTHVPITTGNVGISACPDPNCANRLQSVKLDRENGDYHRVLATANRDTQYQLTAAAPGYASAQQTFTVGTHVPMPLRIDFCLNRSS